MEIEKITSDLNVKHLLFDKLQGCVLSVASKDCLASSEVKLYLKKRYPKFENEIFEKYSIYGRSSLYKYKILNNWQMKRMIRDIDTICVFAGSRKRCVVDRSLKVTKECMEVLKGMDCNPVVVYDKPPCFKGNVNLISVSEAAEELNVKFESSFWDETDMDGIDYVDRPAIRRKLKEDSDKKFPIYYANKSKFEDKIKKQEVMLEGFAPVKKNANSYLNFKKALMNNISIQADQPKVSQLGEDRNSKYSSSSLISAAISKSKIKLVKNLVLSGNLNPWMTVGKKQKTIREDLKFNDNLISVGNYYSSLFNLKIEEGHDCLDEITEDYIRLSTKVRLGCVKMEQETIEDLNKIDHKQSEKTRKRLIKKLSRKKNSHLTSKKTDSRVTKRQENPVLVSLHNMSKSKKSRISQKISNLINFLSSDSEGNRFERLFDSYYPHHKRHLLNYRKLRLFLGQMDEVAVSKIWSKTQTQEVFDMPEEFFKGLEDVKILSSFIESRFEKLEENIVNAISVGFNNVKSVVNYLEREGDFARFKKEEGNHKRENESLLKNKRSEAKKEKKRIEREKKKERWRLEEEFYDQFDCENF